MICLALLSCFLLSSAEPSGVVSFGGAKRTPLYLSICGPDGVVTPVPVADDGSFIIPQLTPGTYNVDVISTYLVYPPYRLDVSRKMLGAFRWKYRDPLLTDLKSPATLTPIGGAMFSPSRPSFNVWSYLPMLVTAVLPLLLMYLMRTMKEKSAELQAEAARQASADGDDEYAETVRQTQETMQNWMAKLGLGAPAARNAVTSR